MVERIWWLGHGAALLAIMLVLALGAEAQAPVAAPPSAEEPARAPLAQPALDQWWRNAALARDLKLTGAQINRLEEAFIAQRLRLIELRADVDTQETLLAPLVEVDRPDVAAVAAQLDQVLTARGRLEKARTLMPLVVRQVLSIEQWRQLRVLLDGHTPLSERPLSRRPPQFLPRVG